MYKFRKVSIGDNYSINKFEIFYNDTLISSFESDQLDTYKKIIDNIHKDNYPISGIIFD